jgi:hypothetical protein
MENDKDVVRETNIIIRYKCDHGCTIERKFAPIASKQVIFKFYSHPCQKTKCFFTTSDDIYHQNCMTTLCKENGEKFGPNDLSILTIYEYLELK